MIKVNTNTNIATRHAVPANLKGLSENSLQNLQTELNPVPTDLLNIEFWPENITQPVIDPDLEKLGDEILTLDIPNKTVNVTYEIVPLTSEEISIKENELKSQFTNHIQSHIDATAQTRGYDSIISATTYVNSTNSTFSSDANKAINWRDDVWEYAIAELAKMEADTRSIPTLADFIAELPVIVW